MSEVFDIPLYLIVPGQLLNVFAEKLIHGRAHGGGSLAGPLQHLTINGESNSHSHNIGFHAHLKTVNNIMGVDWHATVGEKGGKVIFDKVWRLRRRRKRVARDYEKAIRAEKDHTERQRIESEMQFDLESMDDDLRVMLTQRLLERARNLDIPIPQESENWGQHRLTRDGYLSDAARSDLKLQIRKEGRERRDLWKDVLLLISGVAASAQLIWSLVKYLADHATR